MLLVAMVLLTAVAINSSLYCGMVWLQEKLKLFFFCNFLFIASCSPREIKTNYNIIILVWWYFVDVNTTGHQVYTQSSKLN